MNGSNAQPDMAEIDRTEAAQPQQGGVGGPLLVAGGGLAAAFCAASCCGLPVLLGSLGIGSGWLVTVAWLAAPHRLALLFAAVMLMASGAGAFLWRRRIAACAASTTGKLAARTVLIAMLLAGSALTLLGYLYS